MLTSRLLPGGCLALAVLAASPTASAQYGGGQANAAAQANAPTAAAHARAIPRAVPAAVAKTWIKLHQPVDLDFEPDTSIADALKRLQELTTDADFPNGLTFYMAPWAPNPSDPRASQRPSTVTLSLKKVPLASALAFLSSQLGESFHVQQDGIVVFGAWSQPESFTEPQARTWLRLSKPVPMAFADDTTLKDVLNYIREKTDDPAKGKNGEGSPLPIYLDPVGLAKANQDEDDATVKLQLEGAPLSTSLALMLDQIGLTYRVQQDGILVITTPERASAHEPQSPTRVMGMGGGMGGGGMGGGGFR